jgi:hypothetical protein
MFSTETAPPSWRLFTSEFIRTTALIPSMFTHAFLEERNGKLGYEETLLRGELETLGVPVTLFTEKRMHRRQLPLSRETFAAGGMDSVHGAMRQLKIEIPLPNDYPKSLQPFLRRKVWRSTLGAAEYAIVDAAGEPLFVKPSDRRKNFVGRTFASIDDFREIGAVSRRQEVWCSEIVEWVSEFRVYVIKGEIVSIDHYSGDATHSLHIETVDAALKIFHDSGEAPAAFGIDFGVLSDGQTALVEANDGYSLGAYKTIPAATYTDLIMTRWAELVSAIH